MNTSMHRVVNYWHAQTARIEGYTGILLIAIISWGCERFGTE